MSFPRPAPALLLALALACAHAASPGATHGAAADRLTAQEKQAGLTTETLPRVSFDEADYSRPLSAVRAQRLDSTFAALFQKSGAMGLSACVVLPGEGTWRGAAGVKDAAGATPITPDSRFHAGSIGKFATAVLILELVQQRRLALDTPLHRWFPEIPGSDRITVDHLLSHTSGLTASVPDSGPLPPPVARVKAAAATGLLFDPGHGFSYSNPGYMALGLILEKVHGRTLAEVIDSLFVHRLGLDDSGALTAANRDTLLIGSTHRGRPGRESVDYASPGGAGILAATPADLVRALHQVLGSDLLEPAIRARLVSRLYPMQPLPASLFWGRGLMVLDTPLGRMFYLAGRIKGFGAMAGYLPGRGVLVAVMVNDDHPVEPVMYGLVKALETVR